MIIGGASCYYEGRETPTPKRIFIMLVQFLIFTGIILTAGPGHIEGGFAAIEEKGAKAALEATIEEADASSLTGNYGNN